ncbi:MAG: hypothetical protein JSS71_12885 [Armatimonadetes bacterium]|nr:hypothetical protein [Armatimonadota bacterium]MBX3110147.1 hypothetical protein [Fimbriimonadaceae bacterium]
MNHSDQIEPCHHVRHFVERQAAGQPRRWWNLLGWLHVLHCKKCREAMDLFRGYLSAVSVMPAPASEDQPILDRILGVAFQPDGADTR